jgi:hypothetical protein
VRIVTQLAARRWNRRGLDFMPLGLAIAAYMAAGFLAWFHLTAGPAAQRVNIRWAATVSAAERVRAEQAHGLAEGALVEGRTWLYFVRKRSRADIQQLVTDPREDTFHIDRSAFRVRVDRPDLSPRARAWLESDRLGQISLTLALAAALATWRSWPSLVAIALAARRNAYRCATCSTIVAIVAGAAFVLVITANEQIFDATFYAMSNAESLLSGDRIYRDFFEPGVPLASYTAAAAQLLSGHRLIGEFVRQWLFILAGFGIATHLAIRTSRSLRAALTVMGIALTILAVTPIYHHDKLFFFPLMVWMCWRYIDRPTAGRGAACGCVTAIAFLFRHDYGVYLGAATVGAFLLARVALPESRRASAIVREAAAYIVTVAVVLAPWLIAVATTEGLEAYARSRAELFEGTPGSAYASLLHINPIRTFRLPLPVSNDDAITWIQQMALLIPVALVTVGLWELWRNGRESDPRRNACRLLLAGGFLAIIDVALLRRPSYVVAVAPLTAALSARFLASRLSVVRWTVVLSCALTTMAALIWMRSLTLYRLYKPSELSHSVQITFARLVAYPPDYEFPPFDYLRDCTSPGDHILVSGLTPPHVSYYAQRPIAGGHIRWGRGWRSDPAHEAESLALLERQSVPIAFSTDDPVLDNFKSYPRIHAYLVKYYVPVNGSKGWIMVDTRRRPTGTFGPDRFPCFR